MHLRSEIPGSTDDERVTFYFETNKFNGQPKIMEADKCDDMRWFHVKDLPKPMIRHVKQALDNIEGGNRFSEFGW